MKAKNPISRIFLIIGLINLIGGWLSTQWVAYMLDYQKALGSPILIINSILFTCPNLLSGGSNSGNMRPSSLI
mgnify:CR=1 FL=1